MRQPWKTLDPWQKEVLKSKGWMALRAGRQSGKSTIVSIKVSEHAVNNANQTIMIISKTERQALLLFEKVLHYLTMRHKIMIKGGKDRPTRHKITLSNGSIIHSLPTGDTGYGIMGFTLNLLVVDEAAFIEEGVFNAVIPALSAVGGDLWLLSTPCGKNNYFYNAFQSNQFKHFHVSSEDCVRTEEHRKFLEKEKHRLTRALYAQWYLGEFVDELQRMFSNKLIKEICIGNKGGAKPYQSYVLGVDVGHMGEDPSAFQVFRVKQKTLHHIESILTYKARTTDTAEVIKNLDSLYNFKKIYIDGRGVGAGVYDILYDTPKLRRKTQDIDNLKKNLNIEGTKVKKTNKELIYMNSLRLMHQKRVILLNDQEIKNSLSSVLYEDTPKGLRIYGDDTHIVEGIVRALWVSKEKGLNIWVTSV
jgi:hypothetical protein